MTAIEQYLYTVQVKGKLGNYKKERTETVVLIQVASQLEPKTVDTMAQFELINAGWAPGSRFAVKLAVVTVETRTSVEGVEYESTLIPIFGSVVVTQGVLK